MFEDALMESGGKIRTYRRWTSGISAVCNASIACLLLLLPLLHPASLPRQTLSMLLAAPAPPAPPLPHIARVVSVATRAAVLANPFAAPTSIPHYIPPADAEPPSTDLGLAPLARETGGSLTGLAASIGSAAPQQVRVVAGRKPVISSGVMARP